MLRKAILALGLLTAATGANATVVTSFSAGTMGAQAGETSIANFDTTFGNVVLTGAGTGYYTGLTPGVAAPPLGDTTQYLAVLNGGSATFTFNLANRISFDVGSVDDFNSLTVTLFGPTAPVTLSGSQINKGSATGDQFSTLTNGRLSIFGNAGERFTGLTLTSSGNSFEIDNLAINSAVPEVSTWAMFLVGFGALGAATRRRTKVITNFA